MYYSTAVRRPVLHTPDCPHCQKIRPENLGTLNSMEAIIRSKFMFCPVCDPLAKAYKAEEAELQKYCLENGISIIRKWKGIRITTPRSVWQIVYTDKGTKLFHKNELHTKINGDDPVPGYHCQNVAFHSILKYCKYIVEHDYYRMLNPIYAKPTKAPPIKGTKRYRKEQKKAERRIRRDAISNVHRLIDTLVAKPQKMAVSY